MNRLPRPLLGAIVLGLLLLSAWLMLHPGGSRQGWLGYVEGETMYIAAPLSGRLESRAVDRGARVEAGAALFAIDPTVATADSEQLAAQVRAAQAQAGDLSASRQRQAELSVSRAAVAAAQAQSIKAGQDFTRISALAAKGFASRAQLDAARAARDAADAALAQAKAQVGAGEISAGRGEQIAAAKAGVAGAEAALRAQQHRLTEIAPSSPARGVVEQTFYNPGEWVPANSPVVAVLPDDKRKLRFYVPQAELAGLRQGQTVQFTCDGCGDPRQAKISYISPRAEFTPPVIYSEHARSKLVFMVEALLASSDKPLPPGLPVEVVPQ